MIAIMIFDDTKALRGNRDHEVAAILESLAKRIRHSEGLRSHGFNDTDGKPCGHISVEDGVKEAVLLKTR